MHKLPLTPEHREELIQAYWDLYKDVHGFRPRWLDFSRMTDEQLIELFDHLRESALAEDELNRMRVQEAVKQFEKVVEQAKGNTQDAIRWMHDAHGTGGDDAYLEYSLGLPYGYFKLRLVSEGGSL